MTRYAGEWIAAVVADSRALAEDAAELIMVDYEALPHAVDPEAAMAVDAPLVHPEHGSNMIFKRTFVWPAANGEQPAAQLAQCEHQLSYRVRWSRNSTVPIETFAVACAWNEARKSWTCGPRSRCPNTRTSWPRHCACPAARCACILMSM